MTAEFRTLSRGVFEIGSKFKILKDNPLPFRMPVLRKHATISRFFFKDTFRCVIVIVELQNANKFYGCLLKLCVWTERVLCPSRLFESKERSVFVEKLFLVFKETNFLLFLIPRKRIITFYLYITLYVFTQIVDIDFWTKNVF